MKFEELRIVFMGTPEFAVASLQALVEAGSNIVGVITAPDKPKGRGKKIATSAIKDYSVSQNLNILQPKNLKDAEFQKELSSLKADLQIVVAFRMLPESVWSMPPMGTFNLHASLLPKYRGAAPIHWAIINGEKETGITTFLLKHEIDTGNILFQEKEPIHENDTVGDLYSRLMIAGGHLVVKTAKALVEETIQPIPQKIDGDLPNAPKIFKEDCEINWSKNSEEVYNFIRGLSPFPCAWTTMHNKNLKVYDGEISKKRVSPGEFIKENDKTILIGTSDGSISVKTVQLEGKKRMSVEDLLRGYHWPDS